MRLTVAVVVYVLVAGVLLEIGAGVALLAWAWRRARRIVEAAEERAGAVEMRAVKRAAHVTSVVFAVIDALERVSVPVERDVPAGEGGEGDHDRGE